MEARAPNGPERAVGEALSAAVGAPVTVGSAVAVTEGWSAGIEVNPAVLRCAVSGPAGWGIGSVIVKTARPAGHWRSGHGLDREWAALTFLAELGSDAGPRLLAHGEKLSFVVLEDLGAGPALEDLLVGADPESATQGFVGFAAAVGRLHAATVGRRAAFEARLRDSSVSTGQDRVSLANIAIADCWSALGDLAHRHGLADLGPARSDLDELVNWMSAPDPLLVLSNGDVAPQNCRLGEGHVRLLDFEDAAFRHPMLDAAQFRLPFYGGPCWARIPAGVARQVEAAYRETLGVSCPQLRDDRVYAEGMAAATACWALLRLLRLPKLLQNDDPHPMGYSRRGQLLDTVQVAVDAAARSGTLPALRGWFAGTVDRLRLRWPGLPPTQAVYPAYR